MTDFPAVPPEGPPEHLRNALQGLQGAIRTPLGNRILAGDAYDCVVRRLTTALAQLDALRLHTTER